MVLIFTARFFIQKIMKRKGKRRKLVFDGAEIGVKDVKVKITCDDTVAEIAYKLWVELTTRKIAMPIDRENDVIVEVYNSWYAAFGEIRKLLKEIPQDKLIISLKKYEQNRLNKNITRVLEIDKNSTNIYTIPYNGNSTANNDYTNKFIII